MTFTEAQTVALTYLNTLYAGDPFRVALLLEHTMVLEYGWLFFYSTEDFVRTRDTVYGLLGNLPVLVDARTGAVHKVPPPYRESLERYERTGSTELPPAPPAGPDAEGE